MTIHEIRQAYIAYFKDRGHVHIPSAPLIPHGDTTTLFNGSGMQPMVPYLLGEKHPEGVRLVDSQKCFRAEDIAEVGDNRHTTFFEMLGNWSLGDYYKEEQLFWCFEFLVDVVGLDPQKLYVTCFAGDSEFDLPKDQEAADLWVGFFKDKGITASTVDIGSEADGYTQGMQGGRIFFYDSSKNWWSRSGTPSGMPVGEPGGPDSELFYDFGTPHDLSFGEHCHVNCDCGRFVELGNNVFMEYKKVSDIAFEPLPKRNIDFGGGLSRIAAASEGVNDIFQIDIFRDMITVLEHARGVSAELFGADVVADRAYRIIADHIHGAVFMIGDGIVPSNTEQGYILRRLIRRALQYANNLGITGTEAIVSSAKMVVTYYGATYLEIIEADIAGVIQKEAEAFEKTLAKGLREFEKGERDPFVLFTTYGFPLEMTVELAASRGEQLDVSTFEEKMQEHQATSRAGAEQKFKGGLADHSEMVVKLHTAHHLLLAALQRVLGPEVHQRGSNITGERLRIDFSFDRKMTDEEKLAVTDQVNEWIAQGLLVVRREMPRAEAMSVGAEMEFGTTYPDTVSVYFIEDAEGNAISKEFCGGPHVGSISGLGTFRIKKEQASSAGVRRIKGVLE
ncbi:MAG: alanyl-tRNA synthetase [Planctomycetota bacterium]|jgi:alanyl-tRNA synthetase